MDPKCKRLVDFGCGVEILRGRVLRSRFGGRLMEVFSVEGSGLSGGICGSDMARKSYGVGFDLMCSSTMEVVWWGVYFHGWWSSD